jgi:hypothetical protein
MADTSAAESPTALLQSSPQQDAGTDTSPPATGWHFDATTLTERSQAADSDEPIQFESVYPFSELLSPQVKAAHTLLRDAISRLTAAIETLEFPNQIGADDHTLHVVVLLRELFCLREIGDGFAAVVSASMSGLLNLQRTAPPNIHQLTSIRRRLEFIHRQPFASLDEVAPEIERLEEASLDLEPPGLGVLTDLLEEGSSDTGSDE